jgi:phenylalanyl-tRNA synthetase beta chain
MISGRVAELHPDALEAWELRAQRVIVAELAIRGLDAATPKSIHVQPIGRFPVVERDLAVIVAESLAASEVESVFWKHAGDLLQEARLFDLYRGAPLAATEKSLAYRLVFGTNDRTLTEAEVDAAVAAVRAGLESDIEARIRS